MMRNRTRLSVEVVYALADQQWVFTVEIPLGGTVRTAIQQSGLVQQWPELEWAQLPVGIFSRRCSLDTPLQAGDRVEIYRPLTVDPKHNRRRRAQQHGIKAAAQSPQPAPRPHPQNTPSGDAADRAEHLQQDKTCRDNPSGWRETDR